MRRMAMSGTPTGKVAVGTMSDSPKPLALSEAEGHQCGNVDHLAGFILGGKD
jgi:hypothetical protein